MQDIRTRIKCCPQCGCALYLKYDNFTSNILSLVPLPKPNALISATELAEFLLRQKPKSNDK